MQKKKLIISLLAIQSSTALSSGYKTTNTLSSWLKQGNYIGITLGAGKANWWAETGQDPLTQFFMAKKNDSTSPFIYGADIGKEINSWAALQAQYKHYPNVKLSFDDDYSGDPDLNLGGKSILSQTNQYGLLCRFQFPALKKIDIYTLVGGIYTTRQDAIASLGGYGFDFGLGASKRLNHIRVGVGFNYGTGASKIVAKSIKYYIPFTLDVSLNISFIS